MTLSARYVTNVYCKPSDRTTYLKPAWGYERRYGRGLYCWCDGCLRWSVHRLGPCEHLEGWLTVRRMHCECRLLGGFIYCMGMAEGELAEFLKRYCTGAYPSWRAEHTPPPVRRVYPVAAEEKENAA